MDIILGIIGACVVWVGIIAAVAVLVMPVKYLRILWTYLGIRMFLQDPQLDIPRRVYYDGYERLEIVETLREKVSWYWFCDPFLFYRREVLFDQIMDMMQEYEESIENWRKYHRVLYKYRQQKIRAEISDSALGKQLFLNAVNA